MTTEAAPVENVTSKRVVAAIIDIVLLGVLFIVMSSLFGESETDANDGGASFSFRLGGAGGLLYFGLVFGYYFLADFMGGQTLGKKLLRIKVQALNGQMTAGKAALRTVLRIVDGIPVFYLVGFICVATSKQHQRIGDMAAGTVVVSA